MSSLINLFLASSISCFFHCALQEAIRYISRHMLKADLGPHLFDYHLNIYGANALTSLSELSESYLSDSFVTLFYNYYFSYQKKKMNKDCIFVSCFDLIIETVYFCFEWDIFESILGICRAFLQIDICKIYKYVQLLRCE